MTTNTLIIQGIGILVAVSCSMLGTFLVLRRTAMVSDAISHSVLFGIIAGFWLLQVEVSNPILIVTAALSGLLTVWLVELLTSTKRIHADAAIGLVFPLLFSIAVVLINVQFRNVHIDIDAVLLGSIALSPINRMTVLGLRIPEGLVVMGVITAVNLAYIALLYKELKITTFDPGLAAALGISPALVHYSLMGLVSLTAVGAFDHVGAILVIALMIAPPASAYLLTNRLEVMLGLSAVMAAAAAVAGYWVSRAAGVDIAGAMATMSGVIFLACLVFAPEQGLVARALIAARRRRRFAIEMLLVHLSSHEGKADEGTECSVPHLAVALRWPQERIDRILSQATQRGLIERQNGSMRLTAHGRTAAKAALSR